MGFPRCRQERVGRASTDKGVVARIVVDGGSRRVDMTLVLRPV